jgi:hypothetical protein
MITTPEQKREEIVLDKDISEIRLISNYLLVKPEFKNVKRETKSGLLITTDSYKEQVDHVDRIGTIEKLPEKLFFNNSKKWATTYGIPNRREKIDPKTNKYPRHDINHKVHINDKGSLRWRVESNEMEVGDLVLFDYMEAINAPYIIINGEKHLLIRYDDCYAIKRKITDDRQYKYVITDENERYAIIPINGYLICEEVPRERESELEMVLEKDIDPRYLKVKYISKIIEEYFEGKSDFLDEINEGDILIKEHANIHTKLEYYYHANFFGEQKEFVFMQRCWFSGILIK